MSMTAPYTLLVGDRSVHLLSKYSADASIVLSARVDEERTHTEILAQSLVAAQREKEQQQQQQQQQLAAQQQTNEQTSSSASSSQATPTKKVNAPSTPAAGGSVIRDLWGIIGTITLFQGPFIIAIVGVNKIGRWLHQHDIYTITKVQLLPISSTPLISLNDDDKKKEQALIEKLTTLLDEGNFYFSYTLDLTNSAQRLAALPKDRAHLYMNADARFYWNRYLQEDLARLHLDAWMLPIVQGFFSIIETSLPETSSTSSTSSTSTTTTTSSTSSVGSAPSSVDSTSAPASTAPSPTSSTASIDDSSKKRSFQYALISRRSWIRTGPRLHMRGADYEGNAATFSEQEQLLFYNGTVTSFLQTRGSIPLIWHQLDRKQMKPKPVVLQTTAQRRTARKHFETQRQIYGSVVVVSLLDQTGIEADLAEAYETYVRLIADSRISFVAFDFHEICKGGKYENISILLQQLQDELAEQRFFHQTANGTVAATQRGVVRVNCLDCLDRTNVVESVFAHHMLRAQMETSGILLAGELVEKFTEFEVAWKNAWADNADCLSKQYTGTGALKTAFTRTGQWTVSGALMDGMMSAKRYVNQTVFDEEKLQLLHLLLGEHIMYRNAALDECDVDGIFRFRVQKQQLATPPDPVVLEVDIMKGILTHYALKDSTKRVRSLTRLFRVVRAQRNFRRLRLIFTSNPAPKDFDFRDPESREKCMQALRSAVAVAAQKAGADASADLLPLLPLSQYSRPLRLFIATWDLASESNPSFDAWVPRDQELYVFAVQNINYPRSGDFYFSSPAHFCFTLQRHLGARFERVTSTQIGSCLTIIFVHADLAPYVSSTEIIPLRYTSEAPSKPAPLPSQTSFLGRLLGRSASPDPRSRAASPASPAPASEPSDTNVSSGVNRGHAMCLHVHDTGFAFLHQYVPTDSLPRAEHIDLYANYDHIFSIGHFTAPSDRWTDLSRHPRTEQQLSVAWRSAVAPRLLAVLPISPPSAVVPQETDAVSSSSTTTVSSVTDDPSKSGKSTPPATPTSPPASPVVPPADSAASVGSTPGSSSPVVDRPDLSQSSRKGSRAVAFLNELAASPPVIASTTASPDVTIITSDDSSSTVEANKTPPRRKSSRAGEFLQQMNKSEASAIVVKDDSSAPPPSSSSLHINNTTTAPVKSNLSPNVERKTSLHRRAVSDGSKILAQKQRVLPLALTCSLNVLCDFYRPFPPCIFYLSGIRAPNLKLASSVTPLKGEIFLLIEAPFINPFRTALSPKSGNNNWAWEDVELQPFITDTEYLRLRHLLVSAWDIDLLGSPVLIGSARLALSEIMNGPSEQRLQLHAEDSPAGLLTFTAMARAASIGRSASSGKIILQSP